MTTSGRKVRSKPETEMERYIKVNVKNTAGVACIAVYTYICIDVYTCCAILVLKYKKIDIYTIHILFGFTNIYNIPHEKTSTLLSLDIPFLT